MAWQQSNNNLPKRHTPSAMQCSSIHSPTTGIDSQTHTSSQSFTALHKIPQGLTQTRMVFISINKTHMVKNVVKSTSWLLCAAKECASRCSCLSRFCLSVSNCAAIAATRWFPTFSVTMRFISDQNRARTAAVSSRLANDWSTVEAAKHKHDSSENSQHTLRWKMYNEAENSQHIKAAAAESTHLIFEQSPPRRAKKHSWRAAAPQSATC